MGDFFGLVRFFEKRIKPDFGGEFWTCESPETCSDWREGTGEIQSGGSVQQPNQEQPPGWSLGYPAEKASWAASRLRGAQGLLVGNTTYFSQSPTSINHLLQLNSSLLKLIQNTS